MKLKPGQMITRFGHVVDLVWPATHDHPQARVRRQVGGEVVEYDLDYWQIRGNCGHVFWGLYKGAPVRPGEHNPVNPRGPLSAPIRPTSIVSAALRRAKRIEVAVKPIDP